MYQCQFCKSGNPQLNCPICGGTGDSRFLDISKLIDSEIENLSESEQKSIPLESFRNNIARYIIFSFSEKLFEICQKFIYDNHITCPESILQCDQIMENAPDFIEEICNHVGYFNPEEE